MFPEVRYFFYITNDRESTSAEIVYGCNDRCDQENLIAQLAGGLKALLRRPQTARETDRRKS